MKDAAERRLLLALARWVDHHAYDPFPRAALLREIRHWEGILGKTVVEGSLDPPAQTVESKVSAEYPNQADGRAERPDTLTAPSTHFDIEAAVLELDCRLFLGSTPWQAEMNAKTIAARLKERYAHHLAGVSDLRADGVLAGPDHRTEGSPVAGAGDPLPQPDWSVLTNAELTETFEDIERERDEALAEVARKTVAHQQLREQVEAFVKRGMPFTNGMNSEPAGKYYTEAQMDGLKSALAASPEDPT